MGETVQALEREYCPPVDTALFYAIISDYDLSEDESLHQAKQVLNDIKSSAVVEENGGFDPSGSSGGQPPSSSSPVRRSPNGSQRAPSEMTDVTSLSNGMSSLEFESGSGTEGEPDTQPSVHYANNERLDDSAKLAQLMEMFPGLNDYTISHTLQKSDGNWSRAFDELLNQVYFEEANLAEGEERIPAKGIDGFTENLNGLRKSKGKSRRKNGRSTQSMNGSRPQSEEQDDQLTPAAFSRNKWQSAIDDVDFICTRTGQDTKTVSSIYHKQGASVPQTIKGLLDLHTKEAEYRKHRDATDVQYSASELGQDFPTIKPEYLVALISVTYPSTSAAHELAKALTAKRFSPDSGIQIIQKHAPIDLGYTEVGKKSTPKPTNRSADPNQTAALAASYINDRNTAFQKASGYYRKGKSDHLMGAAAGYYSQVGRDYDAAARLHSSAAADALVATQSGPSYCDLHGVDTKNAVRIANERVTAWWHALGEARLKGRAGIGPGYKIVTGIGRHSEGGRGKLGPAVGKMLVREGWKVEFGTGELLVTGAVRKR